MAKRSLMQTLIFVLFLSGMPSAFAVENAFATLRAQRAKGDGELLRFVNRAGAGLVQANSTYQKAGRAPLFCAPEDVRFADVALKQYQQRPSRYRTNFRGYGGEAVVVALMDGLQHAYPCK